MGFSVRPVLLARAWRALLRVVHDAVVGAAGAGAAGAGAVAAEHLRGGPAVEFHQVAFGAAAVEPGMAEVVPEPVRVHGHAALAAATGDHLVDAGGGQRFPVVDPEPQLRPPGLGVPGPGPQVPVEAAGCLVADLDDAVLAALAADGDLPLPQVDVAAPRVTGVVADAGQLGQPDAGRLEYRDDRGVAALREGAARACLVQPGQLLAGEDRDQLLRDRRGLQPSRRVGQLVLGGQPFEELLQGAVLVAGVGAAVAVQQPAHPLLDVPAVHQLPAGP